MPPPTAKDVARTVARDLHLPKPPFWMLAAVLILVVLTWVPLALIARARSTLSKRPRVHLIQDMDSQPKQKTQTRALIFQDHRAMRLPPAHTVARDQLHADDHYYRGYHLQPDGQGKSKVVYYQKIPKRVKVDEDLMRRGQTEFGVYCFPCHGASAQGNGPVTQRAKRLIQRGGSDTVWTSPANLLQTTDQGGLKYGPKNYPDGKLFNTITNGFNNMPAYGPQIRVKDRWAVVAYVRALQLAQHGRGGGKTSTGQGGGNPSASSRSRTGQSNAGSGQASQSSRQAAKSAAPGQTGQR